MPLYPFWCMNNCPSPQKNPCCFLSIKNSTRLFHIGNCILCMAGGVGLFFWVYSYSYQFMKRGGRDNASAECEKSIIKRLNDKYFISLSLFKNQEHLRFGNSIFDINTVLRLRGGILVFGSLALLCYVTASAYIISTFYKSPTKNRSHTKRNFFFYSIFSIIAVVLTIVFATLFFWPIHSCLFEQHRIPVLFLTVVFTGPYKFLEWAVTIQYLRILSSFGFTRNLLGKNITADEPGWLVIWCRDKNRPEDFVKHQEEQKAEAATIDQIYIKDKMDLSEYKYRQKNRARIKRTELAERITWQERVGRYRGGLPDPEEIGSDGSGIFSVDSTGTWGSNITRSMSRSSPDSQLSVDTFMEEDYYGNMAKLGGATLSEALSTLAYPSTISEATTFNPKINSKPKPPEKKKRKRGIKNRKESIVSGSDVSTKQGGGKPKKKKISAPSVMPSVASKQGGKKNRNLNPSQSVTSITSVQSTTGMVSTAQDSQFTVTTVSEKQNPKPKIAKGKELSVMKK